jgi:hypothetical protein
VTSVGHIGCAFDLTTPCFFVSVSRRRVNVSVSVFEAKEVKVTTSVTGND